MESKNYSPDAEYMQQEFEERHKSMLAQFLDENEVEKDYIDEFDDENFSYRK